VPPDVVERRTTQAGIVAREDVPDRLTPLSEPPLRTSGRGTLLLPPWSRAPWLGLRQPGVVLAVIGAAMILACAGSSAELFLSSSSSLILSG